MIQEKTYKIIVASTLVLLLIMSACLPDPLEVRGIPRVKPEIVVSSVLLPGQSVAVFLSRSFGALDVSDESDPEAVINQIAVDDAFVTISSINGRDTLEYLGYGVYGGVFIDIQPGLAYTLEAESETLGKIRATTIAKPQVEFQQISASLYFDGFDDTLAQVTYSFNDPVQKNYYLLNVIKIDTSEIRSNLLNPRDFTRLLDDREFNGQTYTETFRVFPREFDEGDSIAVYLSNVSAEYYNFMKLRLDNRFSLAQFLSEPVNYPTNVEGGKGYFNLYTPDIEILVLE